MAKLRIKGVNTGTFMSAPNITITPQLQTSFTTSAFVTFGLGASTSFPNNIDIYATDMAIPYTGWSPSSGATPTHVTTTVNEMQSGYVISHLNAGTKYYWWARANYGNGNVGPWIVGSPSSFNTMAGMNPDGRR